MTQNIAQLNEEIGKFQEAMLATMSEGTHYFLDYFSETSYSRVLMKAGAQQIVDLLSLTYEFTKPETTETVMWNESLAIHVTTYCTIKNQKGEVVAEGVGSRRLDRDRYEFNNSVKSSRRNAFVDAALQIKGMAGLFSGEARATYTQSALSPLQGEATGQAGCDRQSAPEAYQELTPEQEMALLNEVLPLDGECEEKTKKEAPKAKIAKPKSNTSKAKKISELKDISPAKWLEDVPAMFETDSLENMSEKQVDEALIMIKTSIEKQEEFEEEDEGFLI